MNVPRLSVIIPTYNRRHILVEALHALCLQDIDHSAFEIIVADDGSSDGTEEAVNEFRRSSSVAISYSWDTNRGANAARNRAIRMAKGELLWIINDDTIATPNCLALHLRSHEEQPDAAVAVLGRMTISPAVPPSLFAPLHLDGWYKQFDGQRELDWKAFATCNVSVKARFLHQHGMFDERMRWHEDVELGERLMHFGLRVIYEPAALGYHLHHLKEKDYLGVADREGVSVAEWFAKNPSLGSTIAKIGFFPYSTLRQRFKYKIADLLFASAFFDREVELARWLAAIRPKLARSLYAKLYQAAKRRATRRRLFELGVLELALRDGGRRE